MNVEALRLLLALLIVHLLGDFTPLSTDRMQEAKANGGPVYLIAGHAGVHALLVGLVVSLMNTPGWRLIAAVAVVEFITHFVIDAIRARLGRHIAVLRDSTRRPYWFALGLDQFAHTAVLVVLVAWLL